MKKIIIFLYLIAVVSAQSDKDIFVVNYGWHAGIVVKVEDINNSLWEIDDMFKKFEYIEVGWGDKAFYKDSNPSVWTGLKAGLIPTSSVLHLRSINKRGLDSFSADTISKLTLSKNGFTKLSVFIENSFEKDNGTFIPLSKGLYPNSLFYLSSKKYHLFNTCNVWTAKALQSAELDIRPFVSITTDSLFSQIEKIQNTQKERSPSSLLKHGN